MRCFLKIIWWLILVTALVVLLVLAWPIMLERLIERRVVSSASKPPSPATPPLPDLTLAISEFDPPTYVYEVLWKLATDSRRT